MLSLHDPKPARHGEEDHRGESPSSPPVPPLSGPFRHRVKEKHRKSAGDRSCVVPRTLISPNSFRYVATPRASLGFHEHDSRKILDDELIEKLRYQRSNNSQRQPSFSRPKLQRSRYSFSRRVKHFRRRVSYVLLSPDGHLKSIQKLVLTGVLLFEIFYTPFALSYLLEVEDAVEYLVTAWKIDVVVEILLVTDLLLNFNMSIHKPSRNTSHTSRSEIIRQHLTGSLIADLLGSLPAECVCFFFGDSQTLLHVSLPVYIICHILRFLRFWQLPVLCKSMWKQKLMIMVKVKAERWFGSFQPVIFTVLRLAAGILVMAHYLTCFLHGFRLSGDSNPFTQQICLSALYAKHLRQVMVGMFGSINETESGINDGYCIFLVMIGLITMALVFSSIFIAVANLQTSHMQITRELKFSMKKLKLPNELRDRIQRYHDHVWSEYAAMDGDILGFTRKLPQPLALEVLFHRYSVLVSGLDFWSESSPLLSVEARVFGPTDIIFRQGEVNKELFMMYHGLVELTGAEKEVSRLTQGSTFGELALLVDYNRATCVRAITYVESCILGRQAFYRVLDRYPESRIRVVESVLAAGLRSNEFPDLWARAKTLFQDRISGGTALSDAKETQISSKAAARVLVQAMKLDRGPGILTPACVHQDTVLHPNVSRTNNEPTPADAQILPVLTALSKSIRRMEDDIILVKELVKGKLEKRESGLNDAAIKLTLPLPTRSSIYSESTASTFSITEPPGIKPSKPTTIAKVQPKPSKFRRAATVSSLLDAARQIKHRSNVTAGDTALEHGEVYASRILHPKIRTLQRRMSKW